MSSNLFSRYSFFVSNKSYMKSSLTTVFEKNIDKQMIQDQLLMEIELGTPSKNCQNYGICNMAPLKDHISIEPGTDRKSKGLISIYDKNYLEIDFFRYSLNKSTYLKFFRKDFFVVEEQFQFVNERYEFYIREGNYTIVEGRNSIMVIFNMN